jgi:magnesium-transporting ATPase (P-type)
VIASDKTGNLTKSEMTIERVMTASGSTHISGVGCRPEGRFLHGNEELTEGPLKAETSFSGGSLASNANLREYDGDWQIEGDPTEAAFLVAERKLGATKRRLQRFERVGEISFTSNAS